MREISTLYDSAMLMVLLAAIAVIVGFLFVYRRMSFWQASAATALTGFMVLNYGFANLGLYGTLIPVGYLLMAISLVGALGHLIRRTEFLSPLLAVIWPWLALAVFVAAHVVNALQTHGIYAVRDASMVIDGLFFLVGFTWALKSNARRSFSRTLWYVIVLAVAYTLTYPAAEEVRAASPVSGILRDVPVFGYYHTTEIVGLAILFPWRETGLKARVATAAGLITALIALVILLIVQVRATYVALAAALTLAATVGLPHVPKPFARRILGITFLMTVILLALITAFGFDLAGRRGSVDLGFFLEYLMSFTDLTAPGGSTVRWRIEQWERVIQESFANPATLILGQGVGAPLTDTIDRFGVSVRQPHNIFVSMLARFGIVGLVLWLLFLLRSFWLMWRRAERNRTDRNLALPGWLVLGATVYLVSAAFSTSLEFPFGAIPFYALLGFAVGFTAKLRSGAIEASLKARPSLTNQ